ncbi:O-antigen/teichoic acid export membrane protein [Deinococcus sp. HSC-46F16]|uniref:hypothetical protein n=1 Tax=Deinococcus sp. HSC-46F16 TaxID=2910968 RepID=UPI0020A1E409|nr:hypothetical protein [Deinococcus sp. HSC-46F16]MCP2015603.1 O-antigen/teichoic acid export membrane protein [Deinococcus sp. HSC-46F16]
MLQLIATVAALAGLVLALTQLLKVHLGRKNAKGERETLKGRRVVVLSVLIGAGLGALLAAGGLADLADLVAFPPAWSGAVLGLLSGLVASGGKDAITGIQINGAKARAKAEARYNPAPMPDSTAEWVDATLNDLTGH